MFSQVHENINIYMFDAYFTIIDIDTIWGFKTENILLNFSLGIWSVKQTSNK